MLEHPDVTAAGETGYPRGAELENRDTPEARLEFAEENAEDFIKFALAGDADLLEHFAEHYKWKYKSWLN